MRAHTQSSPRKRRQDHIDRERTSLSLPADTLQTVREFIRLGMADNVSAFVEVALAEKIERVRRDALYAAYEAAARDARFGEDMRAVTKAFRNTDTDGL